MQALTGIFSRILSPFRRNRRQSIPVIPSVPEALYEEQEIVCHGTVTIHANHVTVNNPEPPGSFATMTIPADSRVQILYDGEPRTGRMVVHEGQTIEIQCNDTAPSVDIQLQPSQDLFEVQMSVEIVVGERIQVQDCSGVRNAVVEIHAEPVYPPERSVTELLRLLEAREFRGDVDMEAISVLASANEQIKRTVLRGKRPIPGKPRTYQPTKLPATYDPLHRRRRLNTVAVGTTIALVDPGYPGISGRDVYGREIVAETPMVDQGLGPGVIEVQGCIVAIRNGRPLVTARRIDVLAELVIPGDVVSKQGIIEFDGNVVVFGSVLDSSIVRATGYVEVHGGVLGATVYGERGVIVREAIVGSEVVAGQSRMVYAELYERLKEIESALQRFHHEYEEVMAYVKEKPEATQMSMIGAILLEKRHRPLQKLLENIIEDKERFAADEKYQRLVNDLKTGWVGIGQTRLTDKDIARCRSWFADYREDVEIRRGSEPANIRAASITSSVVKASGNVTAVGAGVYASTVEAENSIFVRGTVRGGFLVAGQTIRVHEFGTVAGTESSAKVNGVNGRITIDVRHVNTLVDMAGKRNRNISPEYGVKYKGDKHGHSYTPHRRFA